MNDVLYEEFDFPFQTINLKVLFYHQVILLILIFSKLIY